MLTKKFEQLARDEAKKSVCNERKVGAIIVLDKIEAVVGRGYNNSMTCMCTKQDKCPSDVVHAEAMAIEDAFYYGLAPEYTTDSTFTMYVTQPPCNKCLEVINSAPYPVSVHVCEQFIKFDDDKVRYDLIPPEWELALAKVLTHGAKKYKPNNWQHGEVDRYYAALRRHLAAWRQGEINDPDSGMPHLWHVFTNVGFLLTITEANENV